MIIKYPISKGESLIDAILKAGSIAAMSKADGYEVVCQRCGCFIDDHKFSCDVESLKVDVLDRKL